jgi:uracil-DNA glycosylase family 4
MKPESDAAPPHDCALCPRLAAYRAANAAESPGWFNAPVPSFGALEAPFLIVGMAPGVRGANRTGRPFTGDYAGVLLYTTLLKFGLASGNYGADTADGLALLNCRITNAVRCVPPANLPEPSEVATCNRFLAGEMAAMPNLRIVMSLGVLSHAAVLRATGLPASRMRFRHGEVHTLPDGLTLVNSYHVSRYNTSTKRLTSQMFEDVVARVVGLTEK